MATVANPGAGAPRMDRMDTRDSTMDRETRIVERDRDGSAAGTIVGLIVLFLAVLAFIFYGIPALRGIADGSADTINVDVPSSSDLNITVPSTLTPGADSSSTDTSGTGSNGVDSMNSTGGTSTTPSTVTQ